MTRKTLDVTITLPGRDKGKTFRIHEMDAARGEKWAMRAFLAMARAGFDIPDNVAEAGMAGIAAIGIRALGMMNWDDAERLADEMFTCVKAVPDPRNKLVETDLFDESIEEIATRLYLRKKVFGVHVDFSQLADLWTSASPASKPADSPTT